MLITEDTEVANVPVWLYSTTWLTGYPKYVHQLAVVWSEVIVH